MGQDGRITVCLVAPGGETKPSADAVLVRVGKQPVEAAGSGEDGWAAVWTLPAAAVDSHATGCRCCSGRSGLSDALGLLFARRARMEMPFFTRVVVQVAPGRLHDLVTILREDDTVSARFRHESLK